MQLPTNTAPSESNLLAPFFSGAGLSSADADALSAVGTNSGKGGFGELFADLTTATTAPKPAGSPSDALLANAELVFCPVPFVPVAAAEQPVAMTGLEVDAAHAISTEGEATAVESALPAPTGETKGSRATPGARETRLPAARAVKANARSAAASEETAPGQESVANVAASAPRAPEHDRTEQQPSEHASEAAFQAPRFTGLPAAALEHRSAAKLPPGLTRLMAAHSETTSPVTSPETDELAETNSDAALVPEAESFSHFESAAETRSSAWIGTSARSHARPVAAETRLSVGAGEDQAEGRPELPSVPEFAPTQSPVAPESALTQSLSVPLDRLLERNLASGFSPNVHATARPMVPTHERSETSGESEDLEQTQLPTAAGLFVRDPVRRSQPDGAKSAAKIAVTPDSDENAAGDGADKSFLDTGNKRVASHRKQVGTDVAKPEADMFTRYLPTPASHAASDHAASGVVALDRAQDVSANRDVVPVAPVSTAHQAVEVVLKTVEQAATHEQKSVNLRFAVGDVDLSVRVELHANQVHTTFRTDSPELRAALSREWEAMTNTNAGERTLKLVPAFVTSSEQSAMNSFAGDTSSRQRDSRAQREADEQSFRVTPRSRGAVTVAPVASTNAGSTGVAPLTSRRLHTVA